MWETARSNVIVVLAISNLRCCTKYFNLKKCQPSLTGHNKVPASRAIVVVQSLDGEERQFISVLTLAQKKSIVAFPKEHTV